MSAQVPSVDLEEVATRNNMPIEEVKELLAMVKRSILPEARRIAVVEGGERQYFTVERRGVGPIVTPYGPFWQYDFRINDFINYLKLRKMLLFRSIIP